MDLCVRIPGPGNGQRCKPFYDTVYQQLAEKARVAYADVKGKYVLRTPRRIRNHVGDLSADEQKFAKTLHVVRPCEPTGVAENQFLSMAVAVHVWKYNAMKYKQKDFGHNNWGIRGVEYLEEPLKVDLADLEGRYLR